jgi:hypothetical protein
MNTSRLADFSEIVSSIAIVITLIFLTIQMQQNTRAIEATTRQGASDADAQQLIQLINYPETAIGYSKPELDDEEITRMFFSLTLYFRNRESEWAQYQDGVLDEATRIRFRASFASILQYEYIRNWWVNHGVNAFDPEFVAEVNAELPNIPISKITRLAFMHSVFASPAEHQRLLEAADSRG